MLIRCVLGVAVIAFGATLPALSLDRFELVSRSDDGELTFEDEDGQENPLMELDAERGYKSEALLSYRSTIAPYGKVVGIRTTGERTFTAIRTWKDVEDFVTKISDERVIVRVLEPWGTELVTGVTINRKGYPASLVRPADPPAEVPTRDPFEKTPEGPTPAELNSVNPSVPIPSGGANGGRVNTKFEPANPGPLAIEPRSPSSKLARGSDGAATRLAYEAARLSLAIFVPHSVPRANPNVDKTLMTGGAIAMTIGVPRSIKPEVKARQKVDEDAWLRESLDLADRLGLLSAKPLVTCDRRQRAFAIYTLYMALKELRVQVDLDAQRLNAALDRLGSNQGIGETEHSSIVKLARSFEKSMSGIMMWDAESMKAAVRSYTAELQTMDNARSMLAFLSRVNRQPEISTGYRALTGGLETQD